MAGVLQFRRYTETELNNLIGQPGEIFINTDDWSLRVQDGATAGGIEVSGSGGGGGGDLADITNQLESISNQINAIQNAINDIEAATVEKAPYQEILAAANNNGTHYTLTLAHPPIAGSLVLFYGGILQSTAYYELNGSTITLTGFDEFTVGGIGPQDEFFVSYLYENSLQ